MPCEAKVLHRQAAVFNQANQRIADLLANVLPAPIAARLEQHRGTIAESHAEATVLFADLTGFSAQLATIPLTKNNEVKYVPLNAEVQAALASLPRHGATVLAWPWGEPISRITLYYAFQRALAAAGITDLRWHDLATPSQAIW